LNLVVLPHRAQVYVGQETTTGTGEVQVSYSLFGVYPMLIYRSRTRAIAEVLGVPQDTTNQAILYYDEILYDELRTKKAKLVFRDSEYEVVRVRLDPTGRRIELDLRELAGG